MKKNISSTIKTENKSLIDYYNLNFIKKKNFIMSSSKKKGFLLSLPMFNRKVFIFQLGGDFVKKHHSTKSMNQTLTIECVLAKNKVLFTIPCHSKGIQIL